MNERDMMEGEQYLCSVCNEYSSVVDPSTPEFNPEILECFRSQLWKYFDLELDVKGWECVMPSRGGFYHYFKATENKPEQLPVDGLYRVYGSTEKHPMVCRLIRCKMLPDKVEALYLHDGDYFIKPTTSPEQQEAR